MNVRVVDYRAPDAAEQFTRSLHETGFGVLTNHPIPQDLVEKIYAEWLAFFNSEEKFDYAFSMEKQDGWFSPEVSETAKGATLKDIKEYFHIYPWGRVPAALKASLRSLFKGPFILAGGFDAASAEAALSEHRADLIAFGRPFLANPDLVQRLKAGAALNPLDMATFYTPGAKGYTDYPTLAG